MLELGVDFFVHTGDIIYYDNLAKNKAMAYYHWDRMFSIPTNKDFHSQVSSYFEKDDHDTWYNDSYRGMSPDFMGDFTFDQGLEIFRQEGELAQIAAKYAQPRHTVGGYVTRFEVSPKHTPSWNATGRVLVSRSAAGIWLAYAWKYSAFRSCL